ncbi:MAG TPA: MBL fold metallo-hydrolase [Trueperaceae bacterium]
MKTGQLLLERLTVGPLQENCYLVGAAGSDAVLLVDPGDEAATLAQALLTSGRRLEAILLTHAHFDHVGALAELLETHEVPVYLHPADGPLLEYASLAAAQWGIEIDQPPQATVELRHGQRLELAGLTFDCLHTPGHAPGHVAFYAPAERLVLAGDALFKGSIGRTDLPFGDHEQLLASIRHELLSLPPDTLVLPGHGDTTTIGVESRTNPFLV